MCEHLWVSLNEIDEISPQNCKGEVGPTEMFLAPTKVDPEKEPAVCLTCLEIYGANGTKHKGLVKFEEILLSLATQ